MNPDLTSDKRVKEINEKVWDLWNKINDLQWQIWYEFEPFFLQKCIDMDDDEYEQRTHRFTR